MVIGFWNINNNTDLSDLLVDFVKENDIDILFLAETQYKKVRKTKSHDLVLDFLIKSSKFLSRPFVQLPDLDFRVKAFTTLSPSLFELKKKEIIGSRWSAYFLEIPTLIKLNIFPVHFHSKNHWSDISQAMECVNLRNDILKIETKTGCENSILIGDFNMNPFESGMVSSNGLNAISNLDYAFDNPSGREIDGAFYKYFYNPMWNYFGDLNKPLGTHYYRASGHVSQEYHILDQVILSANLKPFLTKNSVKIITKIAGTSIIGGYGRPNHNYSDHLPILLRLKL